MSVLLIDFDRWIDELPGESTVVGLKDKAKDSNGVVRKERYHNFSKEDTTDVSQSGRRR